MASCSSRYEQQPLPTSSKARLAKLSGLGADQTIALGQSDEALTEAFRSVVPNVNIVLDYLWGHSAELLLASAKGRGGLGGEPRIRFIQIGSASGGTITLDAQLLRSTGIELLGSGLGSLSGAAIVEALTTMFNAAATTGLKIETAAVPLSDVASAWSSAEGGRRTVFTL